MPGAIIRLANASRMSWNVTALIPPVSRQAQTL
jgi:hypothetical protein